MLCSSNCFLIFFKTFGCAVQAVGPRACICHSPSVKVRQRPLCALFNPFLISLRDYTALRCVGLRTISISFSSFFPFADCWSGLLFCYLAAFDFLHLTFVFPVIIPAC